jgi:hypothetical protein
VTNHKWVIHEEIKDASNKPYQPGAEVMLEADHMPGMKGAMATIDSAEPHYGIHGRLHSDYWWPTSQKS